VRTREVGPWLVGDVPAARGEIPVQALAWDRAGATLLRWIFERGCPESEIGAVLSSCDFNSAPGSREYALFGIRAVLPDDFEAEEVVAFPAAPKMVFESGADRSRVVLRRWGMAGMRFDGRTPDPAAVAAFWARETAREKTEPASVEPVALLHEGRACTGAKISFSAPREHHGDRFMARRWHGGAALVWHDPALNRIMSFEQIGPRGRAEIPARAAIPGLSFETPPRA
ncbi:MAG: hypothetical protein IJ783_09065, partial [Kiritimatiellae bacterium]|nr:hypothetical protein [Kiritimatiellia bacterium]